ncbi:MAG: methyltransferase domain-containing protein [Bacteroidota bacterium]
MRLMQHKREAYWFYRFLSIFYDKYVNPLFWTPLMRDQSLELARLSEKGIKVIDVGSGTGFTTQGIVKEVAPQMVTCVDQSPHQMQKAKAKADLKGCNFKIGDAENIPVSSDSYDRYVSAGSIEYWPDPQQGVFEAYRVVKPGGIALLIGPLEPTNWFVRFAANTWMLFPKDEEYKRWFKEAGFEDIEFKYIRPQWDQTKSEYGIAIAGRKPSPGLSPNAKEKSAPKVASEAPLGLGRNLLMIWRVLIGSLAGFIFIPIALVGYTINSFRRRPDLPEEYQESLNGHQITALALVLLVIVGLIYIFQ